MTTIKMETQDYQSPSRVKRLVVIVTCTLAVAGASALLVTAQPLLTVAAVLALPLIVATLYWPDMATLLTIFILYSNVAVIAVKFHNVPYAIGAAFPLLLAAPLTAYLILRREKLVITSALPYMLLFLFVQFLGTLFTRNINEAFTELTAFIIEGLAIYFLITNVVRTPQLLRRIVWVLLLAGVILTVIPVYQELTGDFDNDYGGFGQISERGFRTGEESLFGDVRQPRLAGAIGEQNRFAQVLLMLVPLGFVLFWNGGEKTKSLRLLALLATGLITAGVLLTFSRGAAVALVVMMGVMVLMRVIKWYQLAVVILAAGLFFVLQPKYGTRLTSLQDLPGFFSPEENVVDPVFESRTTEMVAAFLVFADHPLVGVGPGMFKYYSAEYGNQINPGVLEGNREAHNLFLGIAADHGILGLIAFMGIIVVTLKDLLRGRRWLARRHPQLANLNNAFVLAIVSYLATGLFLHLSYARYFWFLMALAGAAGAMAKAYWQEEEQELNDEYFSPFEGVLDFEERG
jgi:O-antigen ligase